MQWKLRGANSGRNLQSERWKKVIVVVRRWVREERSGVIKNWGCRRSCTDAMERVLPFDNQTFTLRGPWRLLSGKRCALHVPLSWKIQTERRANTPVFFISS